MHHKIKVHPKIFQLQPILIASFDINQPYKPELIIYPNTNIPLLVQQFVHLHSLKHPAYSVILKVLLHQLKTIKNTHSNHSIVEVDENEDCKIIEDKRNDKNVKQQNIEDSSRVTYRQWKTLRMVQNNKEKERKRVQKVQRKNIDIKINMQLQDSKQNKRNEYRQIGRFIKMNGCMEQGIRCKQQDGKLMGYTISDLQIQFKNQYELIRKNRNNMSKQMFMLLTKNNPNDQLKDYIRVDYINFQDFNQQTIDNLQDFFTNLTDLDFQQLNYPKFYKLLKNYHHYPQLLKIYSQYTLTNPI